MSPLFRKGRREEGEARVSQVEMVERTSYAEAKVRIVYSVQPSTDEPFERSSYVRPDGTRGFR